MKIKQNDMVLFNVIGGNQYGLLNPMTRKLHKINETGRFIWEACEEGADTDELILLVTDHFQISHETAKKDIADFIERMIQFQLVLEV